jgi:hypothetical protein
VNLWLQLKIEPIEIDVPEPQKSIDEENWLHNNNLLLVDALRDELQSDFQESHVIRVSDVKISKHQDKFIVKKDGDYIYLNNGDILECNGYKLTVSITKQKKYRHNENLLAITAPFVENDQRLEACSGSHLNSLLPGLQPTQSATHPLGFLYAQTSSSAAHSRTLLQSSFDLPSYQIASGPRMYDDMQRSSSIKADFGTSPLDELDQLVVNEYCDTQLTSDKSGEGPYENTPISLINRIKNKLIYSR